MPTLVGARSGLPITPLLVLDLRLFFFAIIVPFLKMTNHVSLNNLPVFGLSLYFYPEKALESEYLRKHSNASVGGYVRLLSKVFCCTVSYDILYVKTPLMSRTIFRSTTKIFFLTNVAY